MYINFPFESESEIAVFCSSYLFFLCWNNLFTVVLIYWWRTFALQLFNIAELMLPIHTMRAMWGLDTNLSRDLFWDIISASTLTMFKPCLFLGLHSTVSNLSQNRIWLIFLTLFFICVYLDLLHKATSMTLFVVICILVAFDGAAIHKGASSLCSYFIMPII